MKMPINKGVNIAKNKVVAIKALLLSKYNIQTSNKATKTIIALANDFRFVSSELAKMNFPCGQIYATNIVLF